MGAGSGFAGWAGCAGCGAANTSPGLVGDGAGAWCRRFASGALSASFGECAVSDKSLILPRDNTKKKKCFCGNLEKIGTTEKKRENGVASSKNYRFFRGSTPEPSRK